MRAVLRERVVATIALAATIAIVVGVVVAFAAGAHRTSTVADRYTTAQGGNFDGLIYQEHGRSLRAEVAALSGAASVDAMSFVFGGLTHVGSTEPVDASVFSGSFKAVTVRVVSGRDVNPHSNGEFLASRSFMDTTHSKIGDTFVLHTLTQELADAQGMAADHADGPTFDAVLVGVIDGAAALDDPTPMVVFSPALLDDQRIGVAVTLMTVRFRPGIELEEFRSELDTVPGHDSLSLEPGVVVSDAVRNAIDAQTLGLWALAGVGALAAIVALGQLVTRHVRVPQAERNGLSALGYVERQVVAESFARGAIPVTAGTGAGVGIAIGVSTFFPSGFARRLEPDRGVRLEPVDLIAGATVFIAGIAAWLGVTLLLGRRDLRRRQRASLALDAVASSVGPPTIATGLRFAFMRSDRDHGSTRASIAGLALTLTALAGVLTFALSLARLVTQPARYGANYDAMFGAGADSLPDDVRATLDNDPQVRSLLYYSESQARHGSDTLRLLGMDPVRGEVGPPVLQGRLPVSGDEIALGRLAAKSLHVGIGDEVELTGNSGSMQYHVTGLVVVPSIGLNEGIGQDGVMTKAGLDHINPGTPQTAAVLDVSGSSKRDVIQRLAMSIGQGATALVADHTGTPPADIVNVKRIRPIPFVLASLLAALALVTLVHAIVVSVQNRRRDVAVLHSIGADRKWIGRAVSWQATTLAIVPLVIALPAGIVVGRIAFRAFADSMGALNDAAIPLAYSALTVVTIAALANVAAWVAARRFAHTSPAAVLRAE